MRHSAGKVTGRGEALGRRAAAGRLAFALTAFRFGAAAFAVRGVLPVFFRVALRVFMGTGGFPLGIRLMESTIGIK